MPETDPAGSGDRSSASEDRAPRARDERSRAPRGSAALGRGRPTGGRLDRELDDGSPEEDEGPRSERSSKGKKGSEKGSRKGSEKGSGKGSDEKGKGKKGKAKKGKRLFNRHEVEDIVARALERQDRQRREEAHSSTYYAYRSYASPGYYFHQGKYKYWDGGQWTHDWEGGSFGSYGDRSSSVRDPNPEGEEPSRGSTASRPDHGRPPKTPPKAAPSKRSPPVRRTVTKDHPRNKEARTKPESSSSLKKVKKEKEKEPPQKKAEG